MIDVLERMGKYVVNHSDSECTGWSGGKDWDGYPMFWYEGKTERAARILWRIIYGTIPKDMIIRHKCDNPECLELDHLILGHSKDNTRDMLLRDRQGTFNRKVTNELIQTINDMRAENIMIKDIADDLGISVSTVYNYLSVDNRREGAYPKGEQSPHWTGGHQKPAFPLPGKK